MDDIDEWFIAKDVNEHRETALEQRKCKSNEARKKHVRKSHVRWSEMLRLPYFDPIRFLPVDPMHNLFIGIASLTVKRAYNFAIIQEVYPIVDEKLNQKLCDL